jgi:hypothetical protein
MRGSPGHERATETRCGGDEERWQIELGARAKEGARKLEIEGRRCGGGQGWRCPFIWAEGGSGRRQRETINGVNAINGGVGLRGGLRPRIQGGDVTA